MRYRLAAALALFCLARPAVAQLAAPARDTVAIPRLPHATFAVEAGAGELHSRNGAGGTFGGVSLYSVALRWERNIFRAGRFALAYRAEALPLVYAQGPRVTDSYGSCLIAFPGSPSLCPEGPTASFWGFGIAPIGLTASFAIPGGVTAFADANAGMLLFSRDFPIAGEGRVSTLLGAGIGVSIPIGATRTIVGGYHLKALSNGYTAIEYPALRAGVFQLGLGLRPAARRDAEGSIDHATAIAWSAGVGMGAFDAVAGRFSVAAHLLTINARWERTFVRWGGSELRFAVDAIPVAVAETGALPDFGAAACHAVPLPNGGRTTDPGSCPGYGAADGPTVGFGGSPLIIQWSTHGPGRSRLFVEGNAGGLLFSRDFPITRSSHGSFLLGLGGGVEVPLSGTRSLVFGYKLQHLSNGYTAARNPGMNLHYLNLGLAVRR